MAKVVVSELWELEPAARRLQAFLGAFADGDAVTRLGLPFLA